MCRAIQILRQDLLHQPARLVDGDGEAHAAGRACAAQAGACACHATGAAFAQDANELAQPALLAGYTARHGLASSWASSSIHTRINSCKCTVVSFHEMPGGVHYLQQ